MKLPRLLAPVLLAALSIDGSAAFTNSPKCASVSLDSLCRGVTPTVHRVSPGADRQLIDISGVDLRQAPASIIAVETDTSTAREALPVKVPGAYSIIIDATATPKIKINAFDKAGESYAFLTLEQLATEALRCNGGQLPSGTIEDWPDIGRRGVVEGFYGTPWSHATRLSVIDYMGKNKLNTYIFGPKDDPYHSTPHWREPYPPKEAARIAELADSCRVRDIDFIWAIHPGRDIRWDEADIDSLIRKLDMMYELGVRGFAVFFDDISGAGTNSLKQVDLLNRLTENFVKAKDGVANFIVCPTDYSRLWASPAPDGQLATYGNNLHPSVDVCYTGDFVCSDLTHDTMNFVNTLIKRPAFYWWNFPVSDYCRHYLLLGPSYGLDTSLSAEEVGSFVSNPMEHGEASKPALCGVADYCWNIKAFDPIRAWQRGIADVAGEAYDAYRLFSIHSCNSGKGYAREESWETDTDLGSPIDGSRLDALEYEFQRIATAPEVIRRDCSNKALLAETSPWLDRFGELGQDGLAVLQLMTMSAETPPSARWEAISRATPTKERKNAFREHSIGLKKLKPFIDSNLHKHTISFWQDVTGHAPLMPIASTSFTSGSTTTSLADIFDLSDQTFYHSGTSQKEGDHIMVDLLSPRKVKAIEVRQGRGADDSTDIYRQAVIELSEDGKTWQALPTSSPEANVLVAHPDAPFTARYARLLRTETGDRNNWIALRQFNITLEDVDFPAISTLPAEAAPGDARADITITANGCGLPLKKGARQLMLLIGPDNEALTVEWINAKGKVIARSELESSFGKIAIPAGSRQARVKVSRRGTEALLRGWTSF